LRLTRKIAAAVAVALLPLGAAGIASPHAYAQTPSCGPTCADLFNYGPGSSAADPSYLLDSYKQGQSTGTPAILFATNNTDPAQDFTAQTPEPVSDWLQAGLVSPPVAIHYGCLATTGSTSGDFGQCTGTGGVGVDDYAFEIEYSPFGAPTGECVGVASTAVAGEKVTLQPCGISGKTLWIWDTPCITSNDVVPSPSPSPSQSSPPPVTVTAKVSVTPAPAPGTPVDQCAGQGWIGWWKLHQFPLINGSDTNFSQPFVLTYPNGASPLSTPRPQLEVENLTVFAAPTGYPNGDVNDNQLWGARFGTVAP
jgi:hypothetical protein